MSDVIFTDIITVQLIDSTITESDLLTARARFEISAPISAWLDHTDSGFDYTDREPDEPLFYLPDGDPVLNNPQFYLLRGSLETLSEMGWEAYHSLLDAGVDHRLARTALPSNFMLTRTVGATALTLARFVDRHRHYTPGTEVAVIAGGYAAHLTEAAPKFFHHHH